MISVDETGLQRPNNATKDLFRCTWDEADVGADGRLPASCAHAWEDTSRGLNGIAIEPAPGKQLWVNDLFARKLWVLTARVDPAISHPPVRACCCLRDSTHSASRCRCSTGSTTAARCGVC